MADPNGLTQSLIGFARTLTAGFLPQEHERETGETLLACLARRTGVAAAQGELEAAASALAAGDDADELYAAALDR